jgi:hypothetical protein
LNIIDILRNPWGKGKKGNWEGPWSDGSKEFTPDAQRELNHQFGNDSVFWISFEDLLRKYQHFDRTRLFMDSPDWRVTQKWISVEVPWHAEFERRFQIVLKKESPVVLVLSQLDDRYFDGLQGQYSFRLQFRLHEVDSPGEEDYIVRSHGNYLMERSVVTELKSLKAGTYSVFVMVVADRDTSMPSVEDIIKSQTRQKIDNDKLAQVGMAYDLAHRKGARYMESKAAARKAKEKAKAREARIATRRKNWEKRHMSRDILRKQEKKNREKRERKEVKDASEEKEKAEQAPKDQAVQTEDIKEVKFEKEDKGVQTEELPEKQDSETQGLQPMSENDKAVQTEDLSTAFTGSQGTPDTPQSSLTYPPDHLMGKYIPVPPTARGGPPPPPPPGAYGPTQRRSSSQRYSRAPVQHQQYITSDGESSASPISDFDDMYSDDDPTLKPRPINPGEAQIPATSKKGNESDDEEKEPEPWNAVCILGFRVYSKDEGLEVRVFDEEMENHLKEEEGSDGDVEDALEEEKRKEGESEKAKDEPLPESKETEFESEVKEAEGEETKLPVRSSAEELILVNDEKRVLALGEEDSTVSERGASILEKSMASKGKVMEAEKHKEEAALST